jgi:hypothetical protein
VLNLKIKIFCRKKIFPFFFEDIMSEMNKTTVSIFMITFFFSSVVCKQIQIFNEIKEYNLQVVGKVNCLNRNIWKN